MRLASSQAEVTRAGSVVPSLFAMGLPSRLALAVGAAALIWSGLALALV